MRSIHQRRSAAPVVSGGFTLIEVMVTVAIVAILAAIALPSYRDYVMRGQLVDGTNLLSAGRANMERYYQDNRQYSQVSASITPPCATATTVNYFTMTCTITGTPGTAYTLTAKGSGPVNGIWYTIDTTGTMSTAIQSGAPAGWITPSPNGCWIMKKGQTC